MTGPSRLKWPQIVKNAIAPKLPEFDARGRLIFRAPVGDILRGFLVEVSAYTNRAVTIESFLMALYIPSDHLTFNIGHRVPDPHTGSTLWQIGETPESDFSRLVEALRADNLAYLDKVRSVADFLPIAKASKNSHDQEAAGYSEAITGQFADAVQTLSRLSSSLDPSVDWQQAMKQRADRICELARGANGDEIGRALGGYRKDTLRNLKLDAV